jgi:hypothetical protein
MRPYWRPAATVSGDDKWTSRRVATAGRSNVALAAPSGEAKPTPPRAVKRVARMFIGSTARRDCPHQIRLGAREGQRCRRD